jgi:hypothetical protein
MKTKLEIVEILKPILLGGEAASTVLYIRTLMHNKIFTSPTDAISIMV